MQITLYICNSYTKESSESLLRQAADLLGYTNADLGVLARTSRGKPYFPAQPGLHFSVSHSGTLWACAFAASEIGLDVQEVRPVRAAALAARYCHAEEQAWLAAHGNTDEAFARLWAAKESVVKQRGTGIDHTFAEFSVAKGDGLRERVGALWLRHWDVRDGVAACVCTEESVEKIQFLDRMIKTPEIV